MRRRNLAVPIAMAVRQQWQQEQGGGGERRSQEGSKKGVKNH